MARISLSGVKLNKSFSRETECFRANIHLDGVKVATVENDGHGGNDNVWIMTEARARGVTHQVLQDAADEDNVARGEEPSGRFALEIAVCALLDEWETLKSLKRWCKTKLLFRVPGDPEGQWRTMTKPYSPACKAAVLAKYPDALIANELPGVM